MNVALAANGATASASSSYTGAAASGTNNGDRLGLNYGQNGTWAGSNSGFPKWLQIDFNGSKTIEEIDVFTLQDNWQNPSEPTEAMTFSLYGLTGYDVQYWDGSAWVAVPGGSVSNNNRVWKKITFSAITTSKIRVLTNASPTGWSELTEVEAWTTAASPPPRTNVALAANGGSANASSSYAGMAASGTNNGDRKGLNYGQNGTWGGSSGTFPQWLQIDFNGSKTIDEIDIFTLQNAYNSPAEPTEAMTFTLYGLSGYDVQYWNGSAWATVTGGSVSNNNKVWKKITFAALTTSKIRVLTNASPSGWSELTEVEAWGTPATSSGGSPSEVAMARLDPRNRTGTGGEDLLSNNFNWSLPLVSLPGRGLDLGLTLSYNSLVWTRSGDYMTFDADAGSMAPGFRIGFPTIEGPYWNPDASANFYLLVTPSGGRVELRQVGTSIVYESKDSTYLQLTDNLNGTMTLRPTDGSQMNFIGVNGAWRCSQIKDRNGNYINATYKSWGELETVTDTLGRVLTFNYDSNSNLQSITQMWNSQTHEWATFGWGTATIGNNFPGLNNPGPNSTSIPVLTQVGLPDGSQYNFEYNNSFGMISKIRHHASDSHLRRYTTYVAPASATDCPRLTERHDWAEYWTGVNGVPNEVVTSFAHDADGGCRITMPDGTVHKEFYGSSWQSGLTTESRTYATVADANSNLWQKKTTTAWTQDNTNVAYLTNSRVTETNVHDASGNRRRVTIDYGAYVQWGLPHIVTEYAGDGITELRRTQTDYIVDGNYLNNRIIGLPQKKLVYEGPSTLMAKTTLVYDLNGEYLQGLPAAPVQHDANYSNGFVVGRGNAVKVLRWDVNDPDNQTKATETKAGYDITGNVVFTRDALNHQTTISYADVFSTDGVNLDPPRSFATFAYPTNIADAGGFSTTVRYKYEFGAKTRIEGPPPQNQPNGVIQTFTYDDAARIDRVTTVNNGAYTRYVYGPFWVQSFSTVNTVADEAYSITTFDGGGRAFANATNHPGSAGGYKLVHAIFDGMGRPFLQSNPTEVNSAWLPAGDDASGVNYSLLEFDWQGRTIRKTHPDGAYAEASYSGCGCAGGEVVTLTDEVGRQQKIYSDVLGRQRKTEILHEDGTVYSATTNDLNARNQIKLVRQWAGAENGGGAYQDTTFAFDGYGRVQSTHAPQQNAGTATVYAYNADDTIQSVTDARGASATYGYNSRHLVTSISYSAPAGITTTANVSYAYDAAANRTSMIDGLGSVTYSRDSSSRITSETRHFSEFAGNSMAGNYTLTYQYNLGGEVTALTDPFGGQVSYQYDTAGRLSSVGSSGYVGSYFNFGTNQVVTSPVATLVSQIHYRAWGAESQTTFGNGVSDATTFNSLLQPTSTTVSNVRLNCGVGQSCTTASANMGWSIDYDNDQRINYVSDQENPKFDRRYAYDHMGRLKEFYTNREARGQTPDFTNDLDPSRQTVQYDAFSNITNRSGRLWSTSLSDVATYSNDRRQNWNYDAAGNLLDDGVNTHSYDVWSRQTYASSLETVGDGSTTHPFVPELEIMQTYEGDGTVAKRQEIARTEVRDANGNLQSVSANDETTQYVRSTVLNGAVISELTGGLKQRTNIYANGRFLANDGNYWNSLEYQHATPSGSWLSTGGHPDDRFVERHERDPMGAQLPLINTSPAAYASFADESHPYLLGGDPYNLSSGCALDGMPISCSEVNERMQTGSIAIELTFRSGRREQLPISGSGAGIVRVWFPDRDGPKLGPANDDDGVVRVNHDADDLLGQYGYFSFGTGQRGRGSRPDGPTTADRLRDFYNQYQTKLNRCIWKVFATDYQGKPTTVDGAALLGPQTLKNAPRIDTSRTTASMPGRALGSVSDSDLQEGEFGVINIASNIGPMMNKNTGVMMTAAEVWNRTYAHELGNLLGGRIAGDNQGADRLFGDPRGIQNASGTDRDPDPGARLETCLFGDVAP